MRNILVLVGLLTVAGCMDTAPGLDPLDPQISEFNGHTVKIIYHRSPVGNAQNSPIVIKANQICSTQGKKAIFGSFQPYGQFQGEHTYLCV